VLVSQQIHTVGLSWQHSGLLAAGLFAAGVALSFVPSRRWRWFAPMLRECAIIAGLYGLWVLAGSLSVGGTEAAAYDRARWILHAEHDVGLPAERDLVDVLVHHRFLAEVCNLYYATMHFTMVFVFLIWLFLRHRDQYRPLRRVLALTTLFCLIVQLMPVAPPRLVGLPDVAALDGQSVYAGGLAADQLSAMPSVHVAWAVLVGWGVVHVSTSRWRWVAVLHPVLTILIVVATANHYWADGIVAIAILVACIWGERGGRAAIAALRRRHAAEPEELSAPTMARILP
jgi:hypothetical protein